MILLDFASKGWDSEQFQLFDTLGLFNLKSQNPSGAPVYAKAATKDEAAPVAKDTKSKSAYRCSAAMNQPYLIYNA